MAGTLAGPQLPYQWSRILSEIEAAGVVPPASVIDFFVEEHSRCLSGFKNAQEALQRALATQKKFAESSSTGLVPSAVIKSVKMPYVQVMKLAVGIETDLVVTAAKALAEKELSSAAVSCTKYLSALYEVQVCAIRDQTKVANVGDEFAVALTAIGASIMSDATGGDGAVWAPLIARLKMAFTTELETAMVEFVAIFRREAQAKEAKANAVNTARADAEMADGTRPVAEIIDEKIGAQYESTCQRRRRQQRCRPHRSRQTKAREEAQSSDSRAAGQRLRLETRRPQLDIVSSWVSPSGSRFHYHGPDTSSKEFFDAAARTLFVTSKMTELYYDTRIRNRGFHNFTSVPLSHEQVKTLAFNQKFVPKPKATGLKSTLNALDDFSRRLRLRVDRAVNAINTSVTPPSEDNHAMSRAFTSLILTPKVHL
ncbi:hypothetical protein B0H13DRAFT_1650444 [Mycena leptocephala]|nr:hypothetical protein B0H13DRAFT_1650444 [Mycena leptocephala]